MLKIITLYFNKIKGLTMGCSMALILLALLPIFVESQKIAWTFGLLLPLTIVNFICLGSMLLASLHQSTWKWNLTTYWYVDALVYLLLSIVGFGLINFGFAPLYLMAVNAISFVYSSVSYNLKGSVEVAHENV